MDEELKEIIATNLNGFNYEALGAWGLMEHICNLIDMEGYVVVKNNSSDLYFAYDKIRKKEEEERDG